MIIIVTLGTYIHKDLTDLTFMTDCAVPPIFSPSLRQSSAAFVKVL